MVYLRKMYAAFLLLVVSVSACAEDTGPMRFQEGVHYQTLPVQGTVDKADKIEVREFFFYGCSHCYAAESVVEHWLSSKPDDVNFVRSPVLFIRGGEPLARAYFVAELAGVLDKTHRPLFDAIHKNREPLFSEAALLKFFKTFGVPESDFNELYGSFGVSTKVRQADALTREYKITGVPSFVVNGKYKILRKNLQNDEETFEVINYLVEKERNQ